MTTIEEITELLDTIAGEGVPEILAFYVDTKCETHFKRGRHIAEEEVEYLHDRLDKLTRMCLELAKTHQIATTKPKLSKVSSNELPALKSKPKQKQK